MCLCFWLVATLPPGGRRCDGISQGTSSPGSQASELLIWEADLAKSTYRPRLEISLLCQGCPRSMLTSVNQIYGLEDHKGGCGSGGNSERFWSELRLG